MRYRHASHKRELDGILKKIDIILLVVFPIFSVVISLILHASFFLSSVLFYGLPALWFSLRTPDHIVKTILFSSITSIPFGIVIDYIGILDKAWFVPQTVFPLRLFGVIPLEDIVWGFLTVYSVVIFYEHFLDKGRDKLIDTSMKYLLWLIIITLLLFIIMFLTNSHFATFRYAYFWVGLILIFLPSVAFLSFFPRLISKYVKAASYFFVVAILFELTGLQLHQWEFPGNNFIGWVELFGYRFPFEEFFFFFIMVTIAILSYYEFFDDDRR